jgi:hypothetical protein
MTASGKAGDVSFDQFSIIMGKDNNSPYSRVLNDSLDSLFNPQ